MTLLEYFATEPPGAVSEMADYLGITPTWMSVLIHDKKRRPSAQLSVLIEQATQGLVKREDLRPDLFVR